MSAHTPMAPAQTSDPVWSVVYNDELTVKQKILDLRFLEREARAAGNYDLAHRAWMVETGFTEGARQAFAQVREAARVG